MSRGSLPGRGKKTIVDHIRDFHIPRGDRSSGKGDSTAYKCRYCGDWWVAKHDERRTPASDSLRRDLARLQELFQGRQVSG